MSYGPNLPLLTMTNLSHSWDPGFDNGQITQTWDADTNRYFVYVQDSSAIPPVEHGISIYDLSTKAETVFHETTGVFEGIMTGFGYSFERAVRMAHVPGTDILFILLRYPGVKREFGIVTYDMGSGAVVDSYKVPLGADTAEIQEVTLVPVTSGGVTKYFATMTFNIQGSTGSTYVPNKWLVLEVSTAGALTAREELTDVDIPSMWVHFTYGEERDGETDFYGISRKDMKVYKKVFPFTWSTPAASVYLDMPTLYATGDPGDLWTRDIYYYTPAKSLIVLYKADAPAEVKMSYLSWDTENEVELYNVQTTRDPIFDTDDGHFLDDRRAAGAENGVKGTTSVALNFGSPEPIPAEQLNEGETSFSVTNVILCPATGADFAIKEQRHIGSDFGPSGFSKYVPDSLAIGISLNNTTVTGTDHAYDVTYKQHSWDYCPAPLITGISFGEEKDPNYLDFATIT